MISFDDFKNDIGSIISKVKQFDVVLKNISDVPTRLNIVAQELVVPLLNKKGYKRNAGYSTISPLKSLYYGSLPCISFYMSDSKFGLIKFLLLDSIVLLPYSSFVGDEIRDKYLKGFIVTDGVSYNFHTVSISDSSVIVSDVPKKSINLLGLSDEDINILRLFNAETYIKLFGENSVNSEKDLIKVETQSLDFIVNATVKKHLLTPSASFIHFIKNNLPVNYKDISRKVLREEVIKTLQELGLDMSQPKPAMSKTNLVLSDELKRARAIVEENKDKKSIDSYSDDVEIEDNGEKTTNETIQAMREYWGSRAVRIPICVNSKVENIVSALSTKVNTRQFGGMQIMGRNTEKTYDFIESLKILVDALVHFIGLENLGSTGKKTMLSDYLVFTQLDAQPNALMRRGVWVNNILLPDGNFNLPEYIRFCIQSAKMFKKYCNYEPKYKGDSSVVIVLMNKNTSMARLEKENSERVAGKVHTDRFYRITDISTGDVTNGGKFTHYAPCKLKFTKDIVLDVNRWGDMFMATLDWARASEIPFEEFLKYIIPKTQLIKMNETDFVITQGSKNKIPTLYNKASIPFYYNAVLKPAQVLPYLKAFEKFYGVYLNIRFN